MDILDIRKLHGLLEESGYRKGWVKDQLPMGSTAATQLMTKGLLPKNIKKRKDVLTKLCILLGCVPSELILTLPVRLRRVK